MKIYNGWSIGKVGGFCTVRRYVARKGSLQHWAFLLRECKELCDARDRNEKINALYLKPLYI